MKNFVKCLQKGFITKNTQEVKEEFINNIKSFYNLPETMKLNQFRELFIKPTAMDYSLGISTFQVCRTYLKKSNNDINILEKIQTKILFEIKAIKIIKTSVMHKHNF
jgi:hypothetical protein